MPILLDYNLKGETEYTRKKMSERCDLCHGSLNDIYKDIFLGLPESVSGNLRISSTEHLCYDVLSWAS